MLSRPCLRLGARALSRRGALAPASRRTFSEQAKASASESASAPPSPPPPPSGGGGGGGGMLIVLAALGGGAYYFQDEIKQQLGMDSAPAPAAPAPAAAPASSPSSAPSVPESTPAKNVPEGPVTQAVPLRMPAKTAEPAKPEVVELGPVDWTKVREAIVELLDDETYDDGSYGPVFVRLAWHHSGTYDKKTKQGGSEGAGMRFAEEGGWGANAGLDVARARLEPIKARFPDLTYSDLWSFAGTVAIEEMGGPELKWRPGRKDAKKEDCHLPDGLLPDADGRDKADKPSDHLRDIFYRMGFNDQEIVCLSGAHALGRCHTDRSGFWGPWTRAPTTFSNEYFRLLLEERWSKKRSHMGGEWTGPEQYEDPSGELMMLPTDLALVADDKMRPYVEKYAKDEDLFFKDFAKAWIKLQELGVRRFHGTRRYYLFGPRE